MAPAPVLEDQLRALHATGDLTRAGQLAVAEYGPELLRFAAALLRSADEAEEAWADACVKLWAGLGEFRFECSLRTWAYLLVRRACVDLLRRPERRRRVALSEAGPLSGIAEEVRTRTEPFLRTDVKDRVRALRESLTAEDQALLTLRVDRGLAWSEIAVVLEDAPLEDRAAARRQEASLRKRFERLKDRLRELARQQGLLDEE